MFTYTLNMSLKNEVSFFLFWFQTYEEGSDDMIAYCGSSDSVINFEGETSSNVLHVRFRTDASIEHSGFNITFVQGRIRRADGVKMTSHYRRCYVILSHRRQQDVVSTSHAHMEKTHLLKQRTDVGFKHYFFL